jgi:putative SOS response-associated peptidase YedK
MYSFNMCGRYALHANPEVIALQFGLDAVPQLAPRYNICPGTEILAIGSDRKARLLPWGARGRFANARAESVAERPAFRNAFRQFRCLVPASGFYEWQSIARTKRPWYLQPTDSALFALAGLVLLWQGKRSVTLITTEPNELMRNIHDRMPVLVAPGDHAAWLDSPDPTALLRPYPAEAMRAHPVHPRVNTPANDDPALISEFDAQPVLDILPVHGRTDR